MKTILGISLGSAARDSQVCLELGEERYLISRVGTGGNYQKARNLFCRYDGRVDAFGLGGANFYYRLGEYTYPIREAHWLVRGLNVTPVADGAVVKEHLERKLVPLVEDYVGGWRGKRIFFASALDRWPLAEALEAAGAQLIIADALLALRFKLPFHSLKSFQFAGRLSMPFLSKLPLSWLYPLGQDQEKVPSRNLFGSYFAEADVLAGDFHLLRRFLPENLTGKIVLTSTVTPRDRELLQKRGAKLLITTSPSWEGRSFGSNILEAIICAGTATPPRELTEAGIGRFLKIMNYRPGVEKFLV